VAFRVRGWGKGTAGGRRGLESGKVI
jgi:hypothetical protein